MCISNVFTAFLFKTECVHTLKHFCRTKAQRGKKRAKQIHGYDSALIKSQGIYEMLIPHVFQIILMQVTVGTIA